jgi:hypothetical protein
MRDKCCSNESKNLLLFAGGLRNNDSSYPPFSPADALSDITRVTRIDFIQVNFDERTFLRQNNYIIVLL